VRRGIAVEYSPAFIIRFAAASSRGAFPGTLVCIAPSVSGLDGVKEPAASAVFPPVDAQPVYNSNVNDISAA